MLKISELCKYIVIHLIANVLLLFSYAWYIKDITQTIWSRRSKMGKKTLIDEMKANIESATDKRLFSIYIGEFPDENLIWAIDEEDACLWLHLDAGYLPDDADFPFDMATYQVTEMIR
jgi:hypothetical protein